VHSSLGVYIAAIHAMMTMEPFNEGSEKNPIQNDFAFY
jgi:hypothetical protein